MPNNTDIHSAKEAFGQLLEVLNTLREKCPWDKKQTIESLRYLTIEETYELSDAILENDLEEVKKELGDIIMHIVFYSKIASEQGVFNITNVLEGVCEKLIRRHPHVFSDTHVNNEDDVKSNWEKIKLAEGRSSVLAGVPNSLPAMVKAFRMQEKARGVGFDWDNTKQVLEKVKEEYKELEHEVNITKNQDRIEAEYGDLLFALINYSRFINVNPEDALEKTNRKFKSRFQYLEQRSQETGCALKDMTLAEMDEWWNEAKRKENNK